MNKEKMLKWAEALESGKYKQCRGNWGKGNGLLGDGSPSEGFCCLHVALEIEKDSNLSLVWMLRESVDPAAGVNAVREIYDLDSVNQFIDWNDNELMSFPEIALEIREMVEGEEA